MHLKKANSLLLLLLLSLSLLGAFPAFAQPDVYLKAVADVTELGDPVLQTDVVGTTFSVAIYVEDTDLTTDMDMYGFDIQFNWTTQWITYTGYTVTTPVEDYPDVQPPSPYPGILHADVMKLKEAVDESASIPLAEPGTMAWIGYSSQSPAPSFNGSGTICVFNFLVHNQPYCYEGNATIKIHFIKTDIASTTGPISHTAVDLEIPLYCRKFEYPASPMLKVLPEEIVAPSGCVGQNFTVDIMLLGADGGDLDPFWDVAGCDFYLNFNSTLIEALDVAIDPDGDFGDFWESGTFELCKDIDNTEGWVHIAFIGIGATHSPVTGQIRVAEVTFNMTYEHVGYPPPSAPIFLDNVIHDLKNPSTWYILHAEGGLIDLSDPITTQWHTLFPYSRYCMGMGLEDWDDVNGDGKLSEGDQIILLNKDTGKWHDYYVNDIRITLNLTQYPFPTVDDYVWPASFGPDNLANNGLPGRYVGTDDPYNGFGVPYWTGNFSTTYPVSSVSRINCTHFPFTPDEYTVTLTEGVDYIVHPDEDLIELLVPQDDFVMNEYWVDGVNNTLNGWPYIRYVASGIQSVYRWFPEFNEYYNETEGFASNYGYAMPPPSEWWYDPDWTWELEGWWALGYGGLAGNWTWPPGTAWAINYTAATYLTIEYNADPDPRFYYMEFEGTLDEFYALTDPYCTSWHEVYPTYSNMWHCISHDSIAVGNDITLNMSGTLRTFHINDIAIDIEVIEKRCVQDLVPGDPYYTDPIIVDIAGYPHPERNFSPWYGRPYGIPLPNQAEDAMYTACYKVLGAQIDVYTQYPDPYGGQGPNKPSDMFWPQKEVCLFAKVQYNLWPEQQKDVAFQIIDPHGDTYAILCNRTDENGIAKICFRLPWMCDNPEYYFGEWTVIATVDVACEHINDTMNFKYDYLVHIWKVTTDKPAYDHYETITVTIEYGSTAMQLYDILIAVSGLDETGVPFDYYDVWIQVGGADYCTYVNGTTTATLYIPKWARAGKATIHVNALDNFPQLGGVQHYPLVTKDITINAAP